MSAQRVLVVGVERDICDLYTACLRDRYTVETATSGEAALAELEDSPIDSEGLDHQADR